jgi:hypothetical protein
LLGRRFVAELSYQLLSRDLSMFLYRGTVADSGLGDYRFPALQEVLHVSPEDARPAIPTLIKCLYLTGPGFQSRCQHALHTLISPDPQIKSQLEQMLNDNLLPDDARANIPYILETMDRKAGRGIR